MGRKKKLRSKAESKRGQLKTQLRRSSVLEQPTKKTLTRRGYYVGGGDTVETDTGARRHFTPDELLRIFQRLLKDAPTNGEAGGRFWYPYFYLQYYFGCRLSEPALILDKEDVSFEKKQIVIKRLKKTSAAAGFREHVYGMDQRVINAVQMVRQWKKDEGFDDNPYLFPSRRTASHVGAERLSQLRDLDGFQAVSRFTAHRKFKSIVKQCRLPDSLCHNWFLRPTRSILLLASGMDNEEVKLLQGHRNIQVTYQYLARANHLRKRGLSRELAAAGLV